MARPGRTRPRGRHRTDRVDPVRDTGVIGVRAWPARGGGGSLSGSRANGQAARHAAHLTVRVQVLKLRMLLRVGETEQVERALAEMDRGSRTSQMRAVTAPRPARDDPEAAVDVLAPLLDDSPPVMAWVVPEARGPRQSRAWEIEALVLEAIARDGAWRSRSSVARARARARRRRARRPAASVPALPDRGDAGGARRDSDHSRLADRRDPEPALRTHSGNPAQGRRSAPGTPLRERAARAALPADQPPGRRKSPAELFVSLNTIRTHLRNVYAKLGVHSRADAVKRARELGLLSPSSLKR